MDKKPISVFIDSNIYLGFYGYTKEDLLQLEKILDLIAKKTIILFITSQVRDEVIRNRDKVIASTVADFKKSDPSTNLPLLIREYDKESHEYLEACKVVIKTRASLIKKFLDDAYNNKLRADSLFEKIVAAKETKFIVSDDFIELAMRRATKRNPPGKGGSTGDQINWETLLANCPDEDLTILSNDGDYGSDLDGNHPDRFLAEEWKAKKNSKIFLYDSMGVFLNELDGTIKLQSESDKKAAVLSIANSFSFANTHEAIANAKPYIPLFTANDLQVLAHSAKANPQIYQIHNDVDVKDFYYSSFHNRLDQIDPELKGIVVEEFFKGQDGIEEEK